jgi:predicted DCC family thiol-disulfide oxidoreductase YuxK
MTSFDVEVLYDGDCPLCVREVSMIRRRDRSQRIRFTDIAARGFDPSTTGLPWKTLMARIHGRLPDGTMIEGVEVFRRMYEAVGFGPVVAISRLPGIRHALELAYELFAVNRLRLTGRCSDEGCEVQSRQATPSPVIGRP